MSEHNDKEISASAVGEAFRQVITHMKVRVCVSVCVRANSKPKSQNVSSELAD